MNKRLMVVDTTNLFIKNYIVSPEISTKSGKPVGGISGSLRSIQKCIRDIKPNDIIIIFDGPGGSKKKKTIIKDYKEGRKPFRVNRQIRALTDNEEINNRDWQMFRLMEYINNFPVIQLVESNVEADDVVSFIVKNPIYSDYQKVIVSSDKDFIQLLDEKTILYRTTQQDIMTTKTILNEYNIHPKNFVIARSVAGDPSDNLNGIYGYGLKSVIKYFPFLNENKEYLLDDLKRYSKFKEQETNKKFYKEFLENFDIVEKNYMVMNLNPPSLSFQTVNKINEVLKDFKKTFNKTETIKYMLDDGLVLQEKALNEMFVYFQKMVKDK